MSYPVFKFLNRECVLFILLFLSIQCSFSQVTGPSPVDVNSTHTYTFYNGNIYIDVAWIVNGGTIISSGKSGTKSYYATVTWGSNSGMGIISCSSGMNLLGGMSVTIESSGPAIPDTPTITLNCNSTRLTRGTPPAGDIWYWQSSVNGTSTANSKEYIDLDSGIRYYLRAYNPTSGLWSTSKLVPYTISDDACTKSDENYVFTVSPSEATSDVSALTNSQKIENITYYDGLGRPMQSIGIRAGTNKEDIITHIDYDDFGRQDKTYLPYTVENNNGLLNSNADTATINYYLNSSYASELDALTPNPYSESQLESSPLNRLEKLGAPGEAWQLGNGHEIGYEYGSNSSGEVKRYKVNITESLSNTIKVYTPSLALDGSYGVGKLYKSVIKDENHDGSSSKLHSTEEFKDKQGRVVLKRTYALIGSTETAHDTYYVYDDYGNLSFVMPPKANAHASAPSATVLSELCYQYKYDSRNRLVEKKIPGKDWEYIVYNTLDQPILTQDGNQRSTSTKTWTFTKYDAFSRVVYTGEYSSNSSRTALQQAADAISTKYESRQGSARSLTGGTVYYSNSAFPNNTTNITNLYTVNYYDSYVDSAGMTVPSSVLEQPTATGGETKGLPTVSKVKVLTTFNWNTTIFGYDKKGREIYSKYANTYLGTRDVVSSELDFVGKVKKTVSVHTKGSTNITTTDTFSYDHMGRLISQKQKINSEPEELIVLNTYDELGQLESKKVGGEVASTIGNSTGLQIIDYTYNIRGWLKQINDPMNALGADLFAFKINYNNPVATSTLQSEALYNGNISETQWKTANDNVLRTYGYKYDALNRITQSRFSDQTNYTYVSNYYSWYRYDKNGNLDDLQRNIFLEDFEEFNDNDFSYSYNGNKLMDISLTDDWGDQYRSYDYDANGNIIEDHRYYSGFEGWEYDNNRTIAYNHLNLPVSVVIDGFAENFETGEFMPTGNISYIYDALGTKLSKTVSGVSTYYAGNYIYEGNTLKFFSHPEGYVDAENGFSYVYQYKDHLGNIRLSYKNVSATSIPNLEILEENNYYPFGLQHKGYNNVVNGTQNNYMTYNGKELNESLGLNVIEMDMRQYDPAIARFNGIDPLTHYSMGTSVAFDNNPIFWADPSGADATSYIMNLFNNASSGYTRYDRNEEGNLEQTAHASDEDIANGKAILIAFPDQNPKIPSNQGLATWLEKTFDDGNGKVEGAGHAGIVVIDGDTGSSRYFDFGRYKRPDLGNLPTDEGAVRSSKNFPGRKYGLSIPDWDFSKSNEANVSAIVTSLHKSKIFKGYGTIMGTLAEGLDYKAMLKYATEMEKKGYQAFGGYGSSTNSSNPTYCAKFARGVAEAGGFDWSWYVLTGKANVDDVNRVNQNGIKTIKD